MAIVNVNGISGINSITAQSGSLNFYTAAGNNLPISAGALNVGTGASISSPATNVLALGTNNIEAVRITSTGQLQATGAADVRLTLGSGGTAGTNDSVHIRADGANLKFMNASGGATIFEQNGTEVVRVHSLGRVLVGTANTNIAGAPSNKGAKQFIYTAEGNGEWALQARHDSTTGNGLFVRAGNNSTTYTARFTGYDENNVHLNIDGLGRVTTPSQPMAYVTYSGTAITRANIIPFTAVTNQGGHWDNSTYRFTCPVAGVYHASLNMTGNITQSVQVQSSIRQNASSMATSYYPGGPVSISILCAANDYIDFYYNHDNAGYPGATPAQASVYLLG